jgi:formate dehydrogenase subunit delta
MEGNKLVSMVNQIATFYRRQPTEVATAEIAKHLDRYWEARMRKAIYAHVDAGGEGMSDLSRLAVARLRDWEEGKLPFDPTAAAKLSPPLEA